MSYWDTDEIVDGAGTLNEHVEDMVKSLGLTAPQRAVLVAELRNMLVPAKVALERIERCCPSHADDIRMIGKPIEVLLALATALSKGWWPEPATLDDWPDLVTSPPRRLLASQQSPRRAGCPALSTSQAAQVP